MERDNVHTRYSIVIPVYNSAHIVGETIERTVGCFQQNDLDYELILINDGSKDNSWHVICEKAQSNPAIIGFAGIIGMYFIREPFSPKQLVKPVIIVLVIIIAGLAVEIGGTSQGEHQITLINQTVSINWDGYQAAEIKNNTYLLHYYSNDRNNLMNLFSIVKGKADAFFVTWNFYSYFQD